MSPHVPSDFIITLLLFLLQMLNQSLLANWRSSARLVLLLQDQNLQQELVLRLHWEESLDHWRKGRVEEMLEELR